MVGSGVGVLLGALLWFLLTNHLLQTRRQRPDRYQGWKRVWGDSIAQSRSQVVLIPAGLAVGGVLFIAISLMAA